MEILIILGYIALTVLSGVLYRLGGAGDLGDGYDFLRKHNMKLVGVSLITAIMLFPANLIGLFFTIGVSVGVLSLGYGGRGEPKNEQSFLYRIFGEGTFFAVGFLFGLALLPFALAEYLTGNFRAVHGAIWRMLLLMVLIPAIHHFRRRVFGFDEAQVEEFGRGVAIASTLLIV